MSTDSFCTIIETLHPVGADLCKFLGLLGAGLLAYLRWVK